MQPLRFTAEAGFPAYAWPRVWAWTQGFRGRIFEDHGPQDVDAWVRLWEDAPTNIQTWAVRLDEEIGGLIAISESGPGIGLTTAVFKPSFWRQEDAVVEVCRRVYAEAFGLGFHKLTWVLFADNFQIRNLCKKVGAVSEGILRQHGRRGGQWVDMAAYGLLKSDLEKHNGNRDSLDARAERPLGPERNLRQSAEDLQDERIGDQLIGV